MKKIFIALISLFITHLSFSQKHEYQCAISGFYSQVDDIHRTSLYFKQGVFKELKADSNKLFKIGIVNANQWNRNTLGSKRGISIESGLGVGLLREKHINHFVRQSLLTAIIFFKYYDNNMPREPNYYKGSLVFPGFEYSEALLFPIKSSYIGPFIQFSCQYGNRAYQNYFYPSLGIDDSENYFNLQFKLGLTVKL